MSRENPYAGLGAFEKGIALEEDFARWLKEEEAYDSARTRKHVKGEGRSLPDEVDVHAKKYTARSKQLHALGQWFFFMSLICFGLLAVDPEGAAQALAFLGGPASLPSTLFTIGALGFAAGMYGKKRDAEHAYVECKNWKGRVGKSELLAFAQVAGGLPGEAGKRRAVFVSYNGFTRSAKDVARSAGVECYRGWGSRFEKVDL